MAKRETKSQREAREAEERAEQERREADAAQATADQEHAEAEQAQEEAEVASEEAAREEEEAREAEAEAEELGEEAFEEAVEAAIQDIDGAMNSMMSSHTIAVTDRAAYDEAFKSWESKNKNAVASRDSSMVKLAQAREALREHLNKAVDLDDTIETVGEGDGTLEIYTALNTPYEYENDDKGNAGVEKRFWLACQGFSRIDGSIAKQPETLGELEAKAQKSAAQYEQDKAIYTEAVKRQLAG